MDSSENFTSNPRIAAGVQTLDDLVNERVSRRSFLGRSVAGAVVLGASASMPLALTGCSVATEDNVGPPVTNRFTEIQRGEDATHHVPLEYDGSVLLRWGDPLFSDAPEFQPLQQSAAAQLRQFGYNNDFIGIIPLPSAGTATQRAPARALLCVNHEYASRNLMHPQFAQAAGFSQELCEIEMAAHGGSVVEVMIRGGRWTPVVPSTYNRRMTANTPMQIRGPAAGHARLQTAADPTGTEVLGTFNNCAGGITPWGTWLMAEENIHGYFNGQLPADHAESENFKRMGVPGGWFNWGDHFARFNLSQEPLEANRFGWVVEVDPMNPESTPIKRTAMGRFKHEGAETVIAPDGRVVVYMGDDQQFDYVYKFVTDGAYQAGNVEHNRHLLDEGTLYVARFDADGFVAWLPLLFGQGPLSTGNGFNSQADVMIDTRRAADLWEATPMDRPEDIEPDAANGRVFVMLTNNGKRTADQLNATNGRAENRVGQIIEIIEPEGDFAATQSRWEFLVQCGDPEEPSQGAQWHASTSRDGWFGSPDNAAIDGTGRLWVATDGNAATGAADGVWAATTDGPERGFSKAFFRAPAGAEVCGPRFTDDYTTLFLAIQHPGDGPEATFENPTTRWPDFVEGAPPRPSVIAVRRVDGGVVGT